MPFLFELLQPSTVSGRRQWLARWLLGALLLPRLAVAGSQVRMQNIAEWEQTYWKYNLARFDTLKSFAPDLLIVRLGKNVASDSVQQHFGQHLCALVAAVAGPKTKVVTVSSLWAGNQSIEAMQAYSQARRPPIYP